MHFVLVRSLFIHWLVKSPVLTTMKLSQTVDKAGTIKLHKFNLKLLSLKMSLTLCILQIISIDHCILLSCEISFELIFQFKGLTNKKLRRYNMKSS